MRGERRASSAQRNTRFASTRSTGAIASLPPAIFVSAIALDIWYGERASLIVPVVFAAFASAAIGSPQRTCGFAVAAVLAAAALGWPDNTLGTSAHYVAVVVVAAGGALSVWLASERTRSASHVRELERVVDATQLAILQPLPDRVRNLRIVGRYLSADVASHVGGDFYDVIDTPFGLRIVVGDVRGKGVEAVRLASLLLGEFRARCYTDPDVTTVVEAMSAAGARHAARNPEDFATAAITEINGSDLTIVLCGHPQPLLLRGSAVSPVTAPASLPLGLGEGRPETASVQVRTGDRLLLFSDGAFEGRNARGHQFDLAGSAHRHAAKPLDSFVADVFRDLEAHVPSGLDDDVVVVAIEILDPLSIDPLTP